MLLSKHVAEQIVSQLSKVVEQHINIMDIQGMIISSTDPLRIGTHHGGAQKIIDEKLPELMIDSDQSYIGAKSGINLPIEFNGEIIGVIGMTGHYDQVYKYGQIIKKMTEILLLDTYKREQYIIEQKAKDRFLEEWIFGRYETNHPNEFQQRAISLGIDVKSPKRILVFSVRTSDGKLMDDQIQTDISHRIRNFLKQIQQAFLFRTATLFICVFNQIGDKEILKIAEEIDGTVKKQFKCQIFIGIDSNEPKPITVSFKNANAALQLSLKSSQTINIFDTLNFDIYITRMNLADRMHFIETLFPNIKLDEVKELMHILKVFYQSEGSINAASEALFIHKNTLQYRLSKIQTITGYDPRKISKAYLFMVAIKIFESINLG
jgi:carbohydrate diacid regulator